MAAERSASASSRGAGFFHPWGSDRNSWTHDAPVASATPRGSAVLTWAPIGGSSAMGLDPTAGDPRLRGPEQVGEGVDVLLDLGGDPVVGAPTGGDRIGDVVVAAVAGEVGRHPTGAHGSE